MCDLKKKKNNEVKGEKSEQIKGRWDKVEGKAFYCDVTNMVNKI